MQTKISLKMTARGQVGITDENTSSTQHIIIYTIQQNIGPNLLSASFRSFYIIHYIELGGSPILIYYFHLTGLTRDNIPFLLYISYIKYIRIHNIY